MVFCHGVNKWFTIATATSCTSKDAGLSLVLFNLIDDLLCVLFMLMLMFILFPHWWKQSRWWKHKEGTISSLLLHHSRPHLIHRFHLILHHLANNIADVHWTIGLNLDLLPAITLRDFLCCVMTFCVSLLFNVAIRRLLSKRTTIHPIKRAQQLVKIGASPFNGAIVLGRLVVFDFLFRFFLFGCFELLVNG